VNHRFLASYLHSNLVTLAWRAIMPKANWTLPERIVCLVDSNQPCSCLKKPRTSWWNCKSVRLCPIHHNRFWIELKRSCRHSSRPIAKPVDLTTLDSVIHDVTKRLA
jgi:hypothetical protein